MGSSASLGSWPRIRETRSRTSLAAWSTSRLSSNSMVMAEPCSRLEEVMVLTPSRVESCSSKMSVISVSTTLGLAPRYNGVMETIGGSISGYFRNGKRDNEITPKRMMTKPITEENTGRFIDISLIFMICFQSELPYFDSSPGKLWPLQIIFDVRPERFSSPAPIPSAPPQFTGVGCPELPECEQHCCPACFH